MCFDNFNYDFECGVSSGGAVSPQNAANIPFPITIAITIAYLLQTPNLAKIFIIFHIINITSSTI